MYANKQILMNLCEENVEDGDTDDDFEKRTIFCANLSEQVTDEILFELFLQAGPLEGVNIPRDKSGRQKHFAFVTYVHYVSVPYALELFSCVKLFNQRIIMKPKNITNSSGNSNSNSTQNHRQSSSLDRDRGNRNRNPFASESGRSGSCIEINQRRKDHDERISLNGSNSSEDVHNRSRKSNSDLEFLNSRNSLLHGNTTSRALLGKDNELDPTMLPTSQSLSLPDNKSGTGKRLNLLDLDVLTRLSGSLLKPQSESNKTKIDERRFRGGRDGGGYGDSSSNLSKKEEKLSKYPSRDNKHKRQNNPYKRPETSRHEKSHRSNQRRR